MTNKVLLLNRGESIVDVIPWQTAVCLLVKGSVVAPYDYDYYHEIQISLLTAERLKQENKFAVKIEDDKGFFMLPKAVVLSEYANIPFRKSAVNKRNVLKRDKNTCAYCYRRLTDSTGTIDHIIPISRWNEFKKKGMTVGKYANSWKNVVASCKPCNNKKDNRTPAEANMKQNHKIFVPSRDYLMLSKIDSDMYKIWDRWISSLQFQNAQ